MQVVDIKISDIVFAEYNPRKLTDLQSKSLKDSLDRFGFVDPVIINQHPDRNNILVGGHQRVKIWKAMGNKTVPAVYVSLPRDKERELNIRLNKNVGEWAWEDLANNFSTEELINWGFDEEELLVNIEVNTDETQGNDNIPESVPAITKLGDIYELGNHRLMCGDSLSIEDVKYLIGTNKADIVYTDPPYGINAVKTIKNDQFGSTDGAKPFGAVGGGGRKGHMYPFGGVKSMKGRGLGPSRKAIIQPNLYAPVIGDDSTETAIGSYHLCVELGIQTLIFWGGNYYADKLPASRCWIVWDKENTGSFADGELAWTNIDAPLRIIRHMWSGLMKASERGQARVHPTQKPVALAEWCLTKFGEDAKFILDLFGGSGSTLIAAERIGKSCLMMEMSEDYCDVIVKRYAEFCQKNGRDWSVKKNGVDISKQLIIKEYTVNLNER